MDLISTPSAEPSLGPAVADGPGDLAQSARAEALRRARPIFFALGVFFLLVASGGFAGREKAVEVYRTRVQKDIGPWELFKRLDAAHKVVVYQRGYTLFCWATLAIGILYPALALGLRRFPASVPILGTSLTIAVTCFIALLMVAGGGGPGVVGAAIDGLVVAWILRTLFRATRAGVAFRLAERAGPEVADDALIPAEEDSWPATDAAPAVEAEAARADDGILFLDGDTAPTEPKSPAPPIDLEFTGRGPSWGAEVGLALAVVLVVMAAVNGEGAPLLMAILAGSVALALRLTAEPRVRGRVTEGGIELEGSAGRIGFDEIRSVDARFFGFGGMPATFPIRVQHARGSFTIPERRDNDAPALYTALRSALRPGGSRTVHPALAGYVARTVAAFGEGRVWSYRASTHLEADPSRRRGRAVGLAMLGTSFAWILIAATQETLEKPWRGLGGMLLLVSVIVLLVAWWAETQLGQLARIRDWSASSLVITPLGIGLVQGGLRGVLAWDQILDVALERRPARQGQRVGPGITLDVEGAPLTIVDLYDRPIALILERILHDWDPRRLRHPVEVVD